MQRFGADESNRYVAAILAVGFRLPDERRPRRLPIQSEAYGIPFRDEWMGVDDSAAPLLSTGLQVIEEQK